jgi:hypothetical protein
MKASPETRVYPDTTRSETGILILLAPICRSRNNIKNIRYVRISKIYLAIRARTYILYKQTVHNVAPGDSCPVCGDVGPRALVAAKLRVRKQAEHLAIDR